MKKAFTLMELLAIIAILGAMTGVCVLSVASGQGAARVKGAARDVFAAIRAARSQAIVTQQPVIITYSNERDEEGVVAKVETTSAELFAKPVDPSQIQTLTGPAQRRDVAKPGDAMEDDEGNLLEDVLFAPIGEDVVRGIRLKAVKGDAAETRRRKSLFSSNVDFLTRQYRRMRGVSTSQSAAKAEDEEESKDGAKSGVGSDEMTEPLSVVWNTNGRVEPHQVWVYADGQKPEDGLLIRIDRFGAAKMLSGDGREEDE